MNAIDITLCGIIIYQQFFFMWQIHRLLDKSMSSSFAEYAKVKKGPEKLKIQLDQEPVEDLNALGEFQSQII